jgi:hypothetical protein
MELITPVVVVVAQVLADHKLLVELVAVAMVAITVGSKILPELLIQAVAVAVALTPVELDLQAVQAL